jgi:predicted NACHT family NTPase
LLQGTVEGQTAARIVLLGQNGSGKTWFLAHAAWAAAKDELKCGRRSLLPVELELSDWEAWAAGEPEANKYNLAAYLESLYQDLCIPIKMWQAWLALGELIFFVDNLQGVQNPEFLKVFRKAMGSAQNCPLLIACRTDNFMPFKESFHGYLKVHLNSLDYNQQLAIAKAYFKRPGEDDFTLKFLARIQRIPGLNHLVSNPRMLSLLCWTTRKKRNAGEGDGLPFSQTEILSPIVDGLINIQSTDKTGKKNTAKDAPQDPPGEQNPVRLSKMQKRIILEELAGAMLVQGGCGRDPMDH